MTDREWNIISDKAYPKRSLKAPPFLWTRILAAIESEEARRAATWWMQWRWMSRVTLAFGFLAVACTIYLFSNAALPLDAALDGLSNQHHALQMANAEMPTSNESAVLLLGLDS